MTPTHTGTYIDFVSTGYSRQFAPLLKLKPCPFCGSDAEIRHGHSHYYARCTNQECLVRTRRYDSIEKAKDAWNKRVKE